MSRLACLVLAAGAGSRFGGRKQLAPIAGKAMLVRTLERLVPLFRGDLYTVLGAYHDEVRPLIGELSQIIVHPAWRSGLGSSIARGVTEIGQRAAYDGIMLALADQVAVGRRDYARLIDRFDGTTLVAARYADRTGVPALFPAPYFDRLRQLTGDQGARSLLKAQAEQVIAVPMPTAKTDIDTQGELLHFSRILQGTDAYAL
ncbi:nucleotidyltransferase family protein [Sedimenticola hydrogenitrophicus]|uniref:nucleotidyltransferase family protein n=1 Tax=Sedimenticola hydrogenitrophicus TaxID=2967975 RepID=UPI0021A5D20F|nr:nucleotidyltransferase family protein [Sedimenticola hydrogenitrophicus]